MGAPHPDRGLPPEGIWTMDGEGGETMSWKLRARSCTREQRAECLAYEEVVVVQLVAQTTGMTQGACLGLLASGHPRHSTVILTWQ